MKQFEIGQTYNMKSVCDQNCVWSYVVVDRTAATVTITDGKAVKKCRINKRTSEYFNAECIHPLGRYSMAPVLLA